MEGAEVSILVVLTSEYHGIAERALGEPRFLCAVGDGTAGRYGGYIHDAAAYDSYSAAAAAHIVVDADADADTGSGQTSIRIVHDRPRHRRQFSQKRLDQRRLSRSHRPDHRDDLARFDGQFGPAQGGGAREGSGGFGIVVDGDGGGSGDGGGCGGRVVLLRPRGRSRSRRPVCGGRPRRRRISRRRERRRGGGRRRRRPQKVPVPQFDASALPFPHRRPSRVRRDLLPAQIIAHPPHGVLAVGQIIDQHGIEEQWESQLIEQRNGREYRGRDDRASRPGIGRERRHQRDGGDGVRYRLIQRPDGSAGDVPAEFLPPMAADAVGEIIFPPLKLEQFHVGYRLGRASRPGVLGFVLDPAQFVQYPEREAVERYGRE
mmetsp:Transcript_16919/g.48871  ORF Transcript_16919/g.48871 Transcript_16919/m.48871 type:complete len:375 (+) Transcript_16919:3367-4491(+)